jgi:flagellar P-ring protein precursor FlgI
MDRFVRWSLPLLALSASMSATPARVRDLVSVEGIRDNQLVGYGLVVGLNGTGDKRQTVFSAQSLANLLERMGVQVNPAAMLVRNTAAVMVTATLPPFGRPGTRLDATVAAIGDASNLQGGLLILTPLKAPDGRVFAVAQGSVVTGGFAAGRGGANSITVNHPTSGRVPGGAIVEREAPTQMPSDELRLQLRHSDFTVSARLADAINKRFGPEVAKPESPAVVSVTRPRDFPGGTVSFLSEIEALSLESETAPRIVVNERTGTIVLGKEIRIRPVAILHGSVSVEIRTRYDVSQPAPLGRGQTAVTPDTDVSIKEEQARSLKLNDGASVDDLVRGLTSIGATPRDVIAILQSLKAAGALDAVLEVI